MLHHLTLWVPDLARAEESWSWLLGELGWVRDQSIDSLLLFRHETAAAIAIEQSPDMVPGMLHSRFRPGMNHLAFALTPGTALSSITGDAGTHGWATLDADPHPIAGGATVAYLEDRDGFEVELIELPGG